jgi:hypothetical protein
MSRKPEIRPVGRSQERDCFFREGGLLSEDEVLRSSRDIEVGFFEFGDKHEFPDGEFMSKTDHHFQSVGSTSVGMVAEGALMPRSTNQRRKAECLRNRGIEGPIRSGGGGPRTS